MRPSGHHRTQPAEHPGWPAGRVLHESTTNRSSLEVLDVLLEKNPTSLMYWNAWIITAQAHDSSLIHARFRQLMVDPAQPEVPIAFLTAMQKNDPWVAAEYGQELLDWSPTDIEVQLIVARGLRATNRFTEAASMLEAMPEDMRDRPEIAYLYSDCLYADHHFQRAYDIMSAIDLDAIEGRPGLPEGSDSCCRFASRQVKQPKRAELQTLQANSTTNPMVRLSSRQTRRTGAVRQ